MKNLKSYSLLLFEFPIFILYFITAYITSDKGVFNSDIPNVISIVAFVILSTINLIFHYLKKKRGIGLALIINVFLATPILSYVLDAIMNYVFNIDSFSFTDFFFGQLISNNNIIVYSILMGILVITNITLLALDKHRQRNTSDGSVS